MDKDTKVFQAYVSDWEDRFISWISEGVVTEIVRDGVPLVAVGTSLQPLNESWHPTKLAAKRYIHGRMIRFVGKMQAKADAYADEILHDDLTTEEVHHGVA